MKNQKLMPWNRKLTILSTTIALIALMCAALITVPLYAQEVTTLVSNTSETSTGSSNGTHAQSFQTGTSSSGYTVTEVQIRLGTIYQDQPRQSPRSARTTEMCPAMLSPLSRTPRPYWETV